MTNVHIVIAMAALEVISRGTGAVGDINVLTTVTGFLTGAIKVPIWYTSKLEEVEETTQQSLWCDQK